MVLLIVGVLVAMAVFWVGFMLAPAGVLLISYLALSAGERARPQRAPSPSALEIPAGPQAPAGGPSSTRAGGQLGARQRAEAGVRLEAQPARTESELVEAGSVESKPRGVRA
jgi:hypothetical protein